MSDPVKRELPMVKKRLGTVYVSGKGLARAGMSRIKLEQLQDDADARGCAWHPVRLADGNNHPLHDVLKAFHKVEPTPELVRSVLTDILGQAPGDDLVRLVLLPGAANTDAETAQHAPDRGRSRHNAA